MQTALVGAPNMVATRTQRPRTKRSSNPRSSQAVAGPSTPAKATRKKPSLDVLVEAATHARTPSVAANEGSSDDTENETEVDADTPASRERWPGGKGRKAPPLSADELDSLDEAEQRRISARFHARVRSLKRRVDDLSAQFPTIDAILMVSSPMKRKRGAQNWYAVCAKTAFGRLTT